MAVSKVWCRKLLKHKIFEVLKKNSEKQTPGFAKEVKNLIAIKDGEIFVWDVYDAAILTTNLKRLYDTSAGHYSPGKDEKDQTSFQTLRCNNPTTLNVDMIVCNRVGSHIALIGSGGVSVLELPQRRGRFGMFEDGQETIRCQTDAIDERYFLTSSVKLLHADWHPGSSSYQHIVLLCSDNSVRIYDCEDPAVCIWKISLRCADDDVNNLRHLSRIQRVLGYVAVSFDFGRPIKIERFERKEKFDDVKKERKLWPMFLLLENGEVFRLLTSLDSNKVPAKHQLIGPLRMHPAAEDNYGIDACSIVALGTIPEVLVIATSQGKLHHCILLSSEDGDQSGASEDQDDSLLYRPIVEPSLYVFETVELELSLTVLSLDESESSLVVDSFYCPIKLHKDEVCSERYHCSHGAGVHSLVLPWTQKFRRFFETAEEEVFLPTASEKSIVEHLICTKPLPSSPVSPILGVALVTDRLLDPKIICITATLECIVLPLLHSYQLPALPLFSDEKSLPIVSPLKRLIVEPFDQRIQKILRRNACNPLLSANAAAETTMTSQECFQLFSRTTQIFREQYIQRQDNAREEIENRVRLLKELKKLQFSELKELREMNEKLEKKRIELTSKCERATEQQTHVFSRLENLLVSFELFVPKLSEAEISWKNSLTEISSNIDVLKTKLTKLKDKTEYQLKEIDDSTSMFVRSSQNSNSTRRSFSSSFASNRSSNFDLNDSDSNRLKKHLTEEGNAISKLMDQMKNIDIRLTS